MLYLWLNVKIMEFFIHVFLVSYLALVLTYGALYVDYDQLIQLAIGPYMIVCIHVQVKQTLKNTC